MRKGCGGAGGGGLIGGGITAGLYTNGGLIHQSNNYLYQNHHYSQGGNMVHQRNGGGGGSGSGRIFVSNHHHHHQSGGGSPYAAAAALHQSGLMLGHHQGHPGGGGGPHHSHHQNPHHPQGVHRPPPILPAQYQNSHLGHHLHQSHHQYGGVNTGSGGGMTTSSLTNSHFNSSISSVGGSSISSVGGNSGIGGGGGGGGGGGSSSHSSSAGGDMPPVETVVARLETACRLLHGIGGNNTRIAEISGEIQILSEDLRRVGAMLENTYPEVLDRVMSSMRDASAQPCLPPSLRLAIFELVELRASKWMLPSDSSNYYRQRRNLNDAVADSILEERSGRSKTSSGGGGNNNATNNSAINNNANDVSVILTNCASGSGGNATASIPIKSEVIFPPGSTSPAAPVDTPTPSPAKTYREEIVIKNSDSGKVAPTAKERVLSINGYSQQSINITAAPESGHKDEKIYDSMTNMIKTPDIHSDDRRTEEILEQAAFLKSSDSDDIDGINDLPKITLDTALAKQLIQETITRNASPVLEGMVLPTTSSSCSDFPELAGMDEVEMGLKRIQIQSSSSSTSPHGGNKLDQHHHPQQNHHSSSHFSYTVTLGEHSIKILGDDLQYVQEAKLALDDYFLQQYPDLFCASNSIEDVEEEDEDMDEEDFQEESLFGQQRYDRDTLLSLSNVRTPPPDFSHLEPEVRGTIVLEKPREFDRNKFTKETLFSNNLPHHGTSHAASNSNNKPTVDSLPG